MWQPQTLGGPPHSEHITQVLQHLCPQLPVPMWLLPALACALIILVSSEKRKLSPQLPLKGAPLNRVSVNSHPHSHHLYPAWNKE